MEGLPELQKAVDEADLEEIRRLLDLIIAWPDPALSDTGDVDIDLEAHEWRAVFLDDNCHDTSHYAAGQIDRCKQFLHKVAAARQPKCVGWV